MTHRILIVDDNQPTRMLLAEYLSAHGIDSIQAQDGSDAITTLLNGTVDAMFLDVLMPVQDGFEVLRWLQDNDMQIPVIVFTEAGARYDVPYASMVERFGALKGFEKPVTPEKIAEAVKLIEDFIASRTAKDQS